MKSIHCLVALFLLASLTEVSGIECKVCWPPMDKTKCRASEEVIECDEWEGLKYDSCIEVETPASHTLARTCYPKWKCKKAQEECERKGPCKVTKCCQDNLCNHGNRAVSTNILVTILSLLVGICVFRLL